MEEFNSRDLVVITGGTGLASVRSTLNHYYDHPGEIGSVYLSAGFKNSASILFAGDLSRFRTRFHTIFTLDNERIDGFENGLVTGQICKVPFDTLDDYHAVIVGPPAMMRFAALECIKSGVPESRIWVSFERRMSCAVGKCGHCKINETYVCLEGPVFNYSRAKELWD